MDNDINYSVYIMNFKEKIKFFICIITVLLGISYLFYSTFIPVILMILPINLYLKIICKELNDKRKKELTIQFREFCISMCTQLMAGYSLENSIKEICREMKQMYGEKSYLYKELIIMNSKIMLGEKIEDCFNNFSKRCDIEEIRLFSEVLNIAKRSGGDIIEIVKNTADSISQKIGVEREIETIINSKKYELKVMYFIPMLMIIYVNFTSPEMMLVMYNTILGKIIMTACLFMYILAIIIGERLSDIKI